MLLGGSLASSSRASPWMREMLLPPPFVIFNVLVFIIKDSIFSFSFEMSDADHDESEE